MDVKHVFAAMLGGIVSALLGGFLVAPLMLLVHADDGGVGWRLLWILLMLLSGVVGAAFSARWWARRHLA
jgi:MFS family permease